MPHDYDILPMTAAHLGGALEVQHRTFTADLCESRAVFEDRLARFGTCFRVVVREGTVVGYMLCFPWVLGDTPVNGQPFPAQLPTPDCFYIHDITLLPEARGMGLAARLLADAAAQADDRGHRYLSLVAVAQSGQYWDKMGFTPQPAIPPAKQRAIVGIYGDGARLMRRRQAA